MEGHTKVTPDAHFIVAHTAFFSARPSRAADDYKDYTLHLSICFLQGDIGDIGDAYSLLLQRLRLQRYTCFRRIL